MRDAFLSAALIYMAIIPVWGQQTPPTKVSVETLLAKLCSDDTAEWRRACQQLSSDPATMREKKVRAAFLNALDHWNRSVESAAREMQKPGYVDPEGEGQGDEYDDGVSCTLFDVVTSFADWTDPHQACVIVGAVAYPTPSVVAAIAAHPKNAIPCLIERSRADVITIRADAAAVLVQTLAQSKGDLDPGVWQTARQAILNTLHDPSVSVRLRVVDAVGGFGGEDMIPALEEAAKSDRNAANEAIAAIEKRAAANPATTPPR
jgi:HEAT repeats